MKRFLIRVHKVFELSVRVPFPVELLEADCFPPEAMTSDSLIAFASDVFAERSELVDEEGKAILGLLSLHFSPLHSAVNDFFNKRTRVAVVVSTVKQTMSMDESTNRIWHLILRLVYFNQYKPNARQSKRATLHLSPPFIANMEGHSV